MATILNLIGVLLFLIVSLWIVVVFPAKIFIRVIKNQQGLSKILWIVLMLIAWPMANFIYGIWKLEKKSEKILCVVFLIISFFASMYVYQHFDEYLDQFSSLIPVNTQNS